MGVVENVRENKVSCFHVTFVSTRPRGSYEKSGTSYYDWISYALTAT